MHQPKDMGTSHIFYTIRMIWNHTVPEHLKIRPFRGYNFSPFYTVEYMEQAMAVLSEELARRGSLSIDYTPLIEQVNKYLSVLVSKQLMQDATEETPLIKNQ